MPFFGPRFVLTPLLAAIGAILLFIASAAGLAIEPRVFIVNPNLPYAFPRLPALRPVTGFDSGLPTSAGTDVNVSVAPITSIASINISLPPPTNRASLMSALPWSVVELAALGPTTNSGSWPRTGAGTDISASVASIASTDTPFPLPTDRASRVSALPWSVSGSQLHSDSIPDQGTFEHVATTGDDIAVAATAGVSVASTSTGVVITSTSAFDGSLQSDHHISCHSLPSSDSIPARLVFEHTRAVIADVSIVASIVASTTGGDISGDITRVRGRAPIATSAPSVPFSSRYSTPIANCHALASTADADGPTNTASDPTRAYRRMTVQDSSKSLAGSKSMAGSSALFPTPTAT